VTGRDLISASLRLLGVLASGENLGAQEATDGLSTLNRLISGWSNEGLLVFGLTAEPAITLTPGKATYTLGASGDLSTRPMSIEKALIRDGLTDYPVRLMSLSEYASISRKSNQSNYPTDLYDDGGYPQKTITLYPTPSAALSLILFTKRPLTELATLDTALSLPPGYERALNFNLAIDLAPEYGRAIPDSVAMVASESKAAIKRSNIKPSYLRSDEALLIHTGRFNIFTGDYSR
jgi:hypothetical protein